jgi:hypothetical protein
MWYAVAMKRKVKKRNLQLNKERKGRGKKRGFGVTATFSITLFIILSLGIAGILLLKLFLQETEENQVFAEEDYAQETIHLFREDISEQLREDEVRKEETAPVLQPVSRYGEELSDADYMRANKIYSMEGSVKDKVTIGFIGDFLLDDEYAIMANLLRRGRTIENGISEAMLAQMREVDILVGNNEFPFTDRGTPTEGKAFTFRADTAAVSYLHDMGVDLAVLANNHIYDFGETGLLDTLDTLSAAEVPLVGAGRNIEEASAPVYFIVNDMKIAVVAATQIERLENPDTKGATENSAGVFRCLNPQKLYEVIARAKENSDFVIVYIHWGTENQTEIDWAQIEQAPRIAEAGADLIIGDHPHCLQGITYFGDTPAIYSMGNFWFNSKTVDTGMVRVTIGKEGLETFQFVPALQSGCRVDLVYGEEKERILSLMRELSPDVLIDEAGFVSKK